MIEQTFHLQGHRGARGLKPENTLPAFEAAFDVGVTSVETDVHLTRDGVPVLFHDGAISPDMCRLATGGEAPEPSRRPTLRSLTLAQLRCYRADLNPDPGRFPGQDASATPLARLFTEEGGFDPYTIPTLIDLFAFCDAYAGEPGRRAGKSDAQRAKARHLRLDLELKRLPLYPSNVEDGFDGRGPGLLERSVVAAVKKAGLTRRTIVRSFDHRSVYFVKELEPEITGAVLVGGVAPVAGAEIARRAMAGIYCPDAESLDAVQVRETQRLGVRVLPWTVNNVDTWQRLLDYGVDGITTDYPDRLADLLRERGIAF